MNQDMILRLIIEAVDNATGDIEGVHEHIQKLKDELLSNEWTRTAQGMAQLAPAIQDLTAPAASAAEKVIALNAAITAITTLIAGRAYSSSVEYETALANLTKQLDGNQAAAAQTGQQLDQLALKYAQNGQSLVGTMADFVQAGYDSEQAAKLVEDAIRLMIAGDVDAAAASKDLISILKGFNAPASEATRAVDILNEVSNKYATDVAQLADGMAKLSPIAKQAGFSFEEAAGLLTPIIEVFNSGSEASEALKTTLLRLGDDSKPVREALAALGVAQEDANGKLRSSKDIFADVAQAMGQLSAADRQYYTQQLVGIDQAARASVVLGAYSKYLEVTRVASEAAGSAISEVNNRLSTSDAQIKRSEEAFRQFTVTLGSKFKPEVTAVVEATGNISAAMDRAFKAGKMDPVVNELRAQVGAVRGLLQAVADNLESAFDGVDWTPLVNGLKDLRGELGEAFRAVTTGWDLTTVDGLRNAIQAVVNLLGNFASATAGVVDGIEPFLDRLNRLISVIAGSYLDDMGAFGAVIEEWLSTINQSTPAVSRLIGEVVGFGAAAHYTLPHILEMGSAIFGVVGKVVEVTGEIWLLTKALQALNAAGVPVGPMFRGLISIFGDLLGVVGRLPVGMAGVASALAGYPGLIAAVAAAAGGAGYAIGTLINKGVEWAANGKTIGTVLHDFTDLVTGYEAAVTRSVPAQQQYINLLGRSPEVLLGVKQRLEDVIATTDRGNPVHQAAAEKLELVNKALQKVGEVSGKSSEELQQMRADLVRLRDGAQEGSEEYKRYSRQLEELNAVLTDGVLRAKQEDADRQKHNQNLIAEAEYRADIAAAAARVNQQIQQQPQLSDAARAAAEALGINLKQALGGIGDEMQAGLDALDTLQAELTAAGYTGEQAGNVIAQGLAKVAHQAATKAELEAVRAKAVALGNDGTLSAGQLVGVYDAVEKAALKVGDAIAVSAAKSAKAHAAMMAHADDLIRKEFEQAAAFNQRQTASDKAAAAAKRQAEEQKANTTEVASGLAALSAMYADYYSKLKQYGQSYADTLERLARQQADTRDNSDLMWAAAQVEELEARFKRATDAAANLGSTDMEVLRQAISDVGRNIGDGEIFKPLQKSLEEAKSKLIDLQVEQAAAMQGIAAGNAQASRDFAAAIREAADTAMAANLQAAAEMNAAMDDAIQQAAEDSAAVAESFADRMRAIREEARDFESTIDDAIRGINRDGMTDAERRADLIAEMQAKTRQAQEAIRAGDLALAQQLRDRIVAIADGLDQAIQDSDGKILLSRERAAEQAKAYLEDTRRLNASIVAAQEAQADAQRRADLEAIETRKKAEIDAAREAHAEKMAQIEAQWAKERMEASKAHQERMGQLREEAAQKKLTVPGLDDGKPDPTPTPTPTPKKDGLEARAKGGPVRRGEDYVVTEDGPETYLDKDGNAYRLDGDGPTVWTAPDDGDIYPTDARPEVSPMPKASTGTGGGDAGAKASTGTGGGDAGAKPLPNAAPERPASGDIGPRPVLPVEVRVIRLDTPGGPVRVLEDDAAALDGLFRQLEQGQRMSGAYR